jgi:hypothetical protein
LHSVKNEEPACRGGTGKNIWRAVAMIYFVLFAGAVAFVGGGACIIDDMREEIKYYKNN